MPAQPIPVMTLKGVGKQYKQRWAIQDVDLTLHKGEILGFIGPNGAGKTTLMKLMAGLSRVSMGEIFVLGQQLYQQSPHTPDGVGIVLEQMGFIPYLSGLQNLLTLAKIRNIASVESIHATLRLVGLDPKDHRPIRSYSLGMRQRLTLAQAIMEQPQLLLLDEPTNGLDPAGIIDLRVLLRRLADQGVAIFLASHLLTEVERICDRVLLVQQGRVVRTIVPGVRSGLRVAVTNMTDADLLRNWARQQQIGVEALQEAGDTPVFYLDTVLPTPAITRALVQVGVNIEAIDRAKTSLEESFLELVQEKLPR